MKNNTASRPAEPRAVWDDEDKQEQETFPEETSPATAQAHAVFELVKNLVKNDSLNEEAKVAHLFSGIKNMASYATPSPYPAWDNEQEEVEIKDIKDLKMYNHMLTALHALLGVGFGAYFNHINKTSDPVNFGLDFGIRRHKVDLIISNPPHTPPVLADITRTWASERAGGPSVKTIEGLIILFFAVTSGFHAYYANSDNYATMLGNKNNYVRWIEYSISSTIMLYIIAFLSGVRDENIYQSIFALNIAMIYTGQLVEEYADEEIEILGKTVPKWTLPMSLGFLLLFTEFGIIIREFNKAMDAVDRYNKKYKDTGNTVYEKFAKILTIPSWIKYTVFGLFGFYSSFGLVSLYGVSTGAPYPKVERMYLLMSLLSKATLGGLVAYGLGERKKVSDGMNSA